MKARNLSLLQLCYLFSFLPVTFLLISQQATHASGFAILEQSAEGMGTAYAGATAGYGDGSEIVFNPAAMAWLEGTTISHGSHFIISRAKLKNDDSTSAIPGLALSGKDRSNGGQVSWVPSFYLVHQHSTDLHFGLGLNSPFGLATDFGPEWVGRYQAVKSSLRTINIAPAVSYKIAPDFSLGASLNIMYADAELSNAIDFGSIGFATLGSEQASALGLAPQQKDGLAKLDGDDWGMGYQLGASYRYSDNSRIGLHYRSKLTLNVRGDAKFEVPTAALPLTSGGLFIDTKGKASVDLPEHISSGIIHHFNDQWSLLGEISWTRWSRFKEIRIEFDSIQPDTVEEQSWKDTWRYALGVHYRPIHKLTLKTGWTYDQAPVPDSQRRTARIPDSDRNWFAVGADYQFTPNLRAGIAYAHVFARSAKTDVTDSLGSTLRGSWDANVHLVTLGVTYSFG